MANPLSNIYLNPVGNQTVPCLECRANGINYMMFVQTKAHLKIHHNMTKEEYIEKHPQHKDNAFWGTPYKALHKLINSKPKKIKSFGRIVDA